MSIKIKVAAGILLTAILITIAGIIAHRSMTELVHTVREQAQPDINLVVIKSTLTGISNAESSVRAYTIIKDTIYLYQYFHSINSIEQRLYQLSELVDDSEQQRRIDSLAKLVQYKFNVLDQLIYLKRDDQVVRVFEKINANLTNVEEELSNKKRRFWNSLTKRRNEALAMADIQDAVSEIKEAEFLEAENIYKKELELMQKDSLIMVKIRKIVSEMEMQETYVSAKRAAKATKIANKATNTITAFSIMVFLLLILLGYLIFTWITKHKKINNALTEAKLKAERLAQLKAEFLANMSHEVRTPMNAIVGFSEQLASTTLSEKQEKYLSTIRSSSEHLLAVINDILDQAKLESGKMAFEKAGFEIRKVVDSVRKTLSQQAESKGLSLITTIDDDIPEVLIGDPFRLTQILINLTSNAVKFTVEGKVVIRCKSILKNTKELKLQIEVEDTGIGIDQENLNNVFDDFYQTDVGSTRQHGGTGLGLTITKRLVELQEGTIRVASEKGKGSKFTVTIPYKIGAKTDLEQHREAANRDEGALKGKSILVADDEEYNRLLLKTILQKWQMKITLCENGKEVLEALESNHYDLILMDVRMPEMNGLEATKSIRAQFNAPFNRIPIIALTAAASNSDAQKCIRAGMDDFLSKPFKGVQLYQKITEVLKIEEDVQQIEKEKNDQQSDNSVMYDLKELSQLSNGDEQFVIDMLETFIRNAKTDINKMDEAFSNGHLEAVSLWAHKVVAPCRHLGLKELSIKLKKIENTAQSAEKREIEQLIDQVKNEAGEIFKSLEAEITKRQESN